MEDLSSIREEIRQLHERSQNTKTEVKVLQTKFDERHLALMEKIEKLTNDIERLNNRFDSEMSSLLEKVDQLNNLANQGKTSLRTLWFIGGLVAAVGAAIATWSDLLFK
jgi:predicted  nucleic acid-binding Zn-ribbon protein